jgi:hypothetical protein
LRYRPITKHSEKKMNFPKTGSPDLDWTRATDVCLNPQILEYRRSNLDPDHK